MNIFITDLAAYNNGKLTGEWVDPSDFYNEGGLEQYIRDEILEEGEEWFITDYEQFPNLGEHPSLTEIIEIANLCEDYPWEAIDLWLGHVGGAEYYTEFEDAYITYCDKQEDFAYEMIRERYYAELKDLPDTIKHHIDYEGIARDWFIDTYLWLDGYVFYRH